MICTQMYFKWLLISLTAIVMTTSFVLSTLSVLVGILAACTNDIFAGSVLTVVGIFLGFMGSAAIDIIRYLMNKKVR